MLWVVCGAVDSSSAEEGGEDVVPVQDENTRREARTSRMTALIFISFILSMDS